MIRHLVVFVVFAAGLAALGWIGAGYAGSNPLALAVTLLIGVFYLAGALELWRYRQATAALAQAVAGLSAPPDDLAAWLDRLPAGLRNAVRLRIEGERVALPAPALTPYLVGLLVLLGMLGTFLGMIATLRGTGLALQSATDLQAIRASLAAPVQGLGFAFGTSVAGVASSAMLGLLAALSRRERIQAAQTLDTRIATTLRAHSPAQQRADVLDLLRRQAEAVPAMIAQLQAMAADMTQQNRALQDRLAASHDVLHGKTEAANTRLVRAMEQALQDSAAASARAAGAAIQPAVEATLAGLARETEALRGSVAQAVQQQLDGLSLRLDAGAATLAEGWNQALSQHRHAGETLATDLRATLSQFADTFDTRSAALVQTMDQSQAALLQTMSRSQTELLQTVDQSQAELVQTVGQSQTELLQSVGQSHAALVQTVNQSQTTLTQTASQAQAALLRTADESQTALLQTVNASQSTLLQTVSESQAALLQTMNASQAALQSALAGQDQQRLRTWADALAAIAASLRDEWTEAGAQAERRHQALSDTLARTVTELSSQTQTHARDTIAEVARLVQAAAEAPRAAAEVIGELRQKLTDSMARDNAMLDERARLLETLGTLLDAVNHASTEQRAAVDALVATSADLLDRVGDRLAGKVESETGKLAAAAAQVTGSAVEVASLGEAFGAAVDRYGQSNAQLVAGLQGIEAALDKSLARSDEQLAYYVAQAREVVDLSVLSQRQILEDLQRLAGSAPAGAEAAGGGS